MRGIRYVATAWCCLFITASACCMPVIKGKVVESGSGKALEFAEVLVLHEGTLDAAHHAQTNTEGLFSLTKALNGKYDIQVRLVGYEPYVGAPVSLHNTAVVDLGVIELRPLEVGIAEVEVVAQRKQVIYKLDRRIIDASSNVLAAGGTAVDILENTPSIRVDAEGGVTFRGSSGFTVYVDGKPSVFSGTQALEQIPAGHIQNIEIITTPSARHDTGGDVGIINIITKKQLNSGLSGMVNLSGSTMGSFAGDFLITQQQKKNRWYLGGNVSERYRKSDFKQDKTTIVDNITTKSHSKGPRESKEYNYSLRGGWQYMLPQTTFFVDLEGGYGGRSRRGDLEYTEERSRDGAIFEQGDFTSPDRYDLHETFGLGSLGFTHTFAKKGHTLNGSFYLKYGGNALEYFQSDLFAGDRREAGHRAWEAEHRWTTRVNLDYTLPYSKTGHLEAGFQYSAYSEDGDYSMQFWDPAEQIFYWRDDIYNTFYFQRGVSSLYGIINERINWLEIQAGVRAEHTHQELGSSIPGAKRTVNRFEAFPSAHVGFNLTKTQKLTAAYSRRTTRPELFFMEPYITYRDYYTAEIGNPDIRPEYINSYELTYNVSLGEQSISASLFHRSRRDKIERLRVPYHVPGVTLDSMANVGRDYASGLEVNAMLKTTRWWTLNVNGSLYAYKIRNERSLGGRSEQSTNYEIAVNNTFDVGRTTRIQFDGNFVGPSATTQGGTESFYYFNLALRQQILKRKLVGTLAFRDVFGTARYVSNITSPDLISTTHIRPKFPLITLTVSYTFNNFKTAAGSGKVSHDLFEGTNH